MREGGGGRGGGGGGGDGESEEGIHRKEGDGSRGETSSRLTEEHKKDGGKKQRKEKSKRETGADDRPLSGRTTSSLADEIELMARKKKELVMKGKEPGEWKQSIQEQIEKELERRVRDALETPPLERMRRNRHKAKLREQEIRRRAKEKRSLSLQECDSHARALPSLRDKFPWNDINSNTTAYSNPEGHAMDGRPWFERELYERHLRDFNKESGSDSSASYLDLNFNQSSSYRTQETGDGSQVPKARMTRSLGSGVTVTRDMVDAFAKDVAAKDAASGQEVTDSEEERTIAEIRRKIFHRFTSAGFREAMKKGKTKLRKIGNGKYVDKNGVVLTTDGPFWPPECGPLYPKPDHSLKVPSTAEPLYDNVPQDGRTVHTQRTKWYRPWEGSQTVFDSERTSKGTVPHSVPEGCCPSLLFESRFESGNLRQARRVGQFEYDLVLKTDLYTSRHTQWFYFRVQKTMPGVTYKFNIINLLKKDSLYNHGMRPLVYSEKEAESSGVGWVRAGHHIAYNRNIGFNRNGLLNPELTYYTLEWQMEFKHEEDTCYLAHCYPFTFTDLCQHLDELMSQPERRKTMRRSVLCESRAGNSCFILTISNFNDPGPKKGIVVTARVHPGETNASWMMKGLLDFITSSDTVAKELRKRFIFKIVPMLNPDGVIVGNYRCSLTGRDLNRNYRHPKKESFPTVWNTKQMLADFAEECEEVVVYCDMHGHSRKHNVFIYGCDPESREVDMGAFLCQRLFPWLLSQKAPDKFSFRGCKFRVKRCKEATGRVVMWRQMGITNSFTLEATFCGSKNITSDAPRHFNLQDFQDLGKHFCEALLVYHQAQENSSLHSELILELTREITHHILLSRGLLPPNIALSEFTPQSDQKGSKSKKQGHKEGGSPIGTQQQAPPSGSGLDWGAGLDKRMRSKLEALRVIDNLSSETIQGCVDLLVDLHIRREFAESDTSDSDSASESEIQESKEDDKKKRRKKKKGKTKEQDNPDVDDQPKKKALKKYPPFVNRYANRTNHGIPMFSQERIAERAKVAHDNEYAKLIALSREMHRQNEEVRYKLMNPAINEGALQKDMAHMKIRHTYTHGNSLIQGPPSFTADLERMDQDINSGKPGAPPRTPPRKLDPMKGAARSSKKGVEKRAAFRSYTLGTNGSKVEDGVLVGGSPQGCGMGDSGYVIADGLLVSGGEQRGTRTGDDTESERTSSGTNGNDDGVGQQRSNEQQRTIPSASLGDNLVRQNAAENNNGDAGRTFVFDANDCKPNTSSFGSNSSWSATTKAKQSMKDVREAKYHSANATHSNRRQLSNHNNINGNNFNGNNINGKNKNSKPGRENTMDLIQRQYGRFLSGVNLGSMDGSSPTSKYLDSIAKSMSSGGIQSPLTMSGGNQSAPARENGGGVITLSRSAGPVGEKKIIAPMSRMGDRAAILKLADSKHKKSNSTS